MFRVSASACSELRPAENPAKPRRSLTKIVSSKARSPGSEPQAGAQRTGSTWSLRKDGCGPVLAAHPRSGSNSCKMNTYAKGAANPRGMNTSKIIELKASWNEHLQKNGGGGGLIVTQPPPAVTVPPCGELVPGDVRIGQVAHRDLPHPGAVCVVRIVGRGVARPSRGIAAHGGSRRSGKRPRVITASRVAGAGGVCSIHRR